MNNELENLIIGQIYEAALDVSLWPKVIQHIVQYTESKAAMLTALDQLNPAYNFIYTYNLPQQSVERGQQERIKSIDKKLHFPLWQKLGVGNTLSQNLSHYSQMLGTDEFIFYEKCLKPIGICFVAAVLLDQGDHQWSLLGIHRSEQDQPFSQFELDILKRIGLHLRRALQIHKQLSLARLENHNLYQILNAAKTGILLIDLDRKVHYLNQKAQSIFEKSNVVELDKNNRINVSKTAQPDLEQLILSTRLKSEYTKKQVGGLLALTDQAGHKFMLTVAPFNSTQHFPDLKDYLNEYILLFITETEKKYTLAVPYLKKVYGLSKKECELCELFVNGYNLEQISVHCNLALSSVRTYLKNIYAKMQCNTQVEFLYKLIGLTLDFEHVS
ncbi:MAG: helix-turn-helix transcriptional regulator [Acinetobacter sp.]